jgi:hypothetical protein
MERVRWLHAWVARELPMVFAADTSPGQRLRLLRHWAWAHIPYADPPLKIDEDRTAWLALDAPGLFARLARGDGGVYCGGATHALQLLLETFGFTTARVSMMLPRPWGAGHAMTLVQLQRESGPAWVVQDAYFDRGYTDAAGRWLSLEEMVRRAAAGKPQDIVVQEGLGLLPPPSVWVHPKTAAGRDAKELAQALWAADADDPQPAQGPDGIMQLRGPRRFARYAVVYEPFRAALREIGLPADERMMFLFPNTGAPPTVEEARQRLRVCCAGQEPLTGG